MLLKHGQLANLLLYLQHVSISGHTVLTVIVKSLASDKQVMLNDTHHAR